MEGSGRYITLDKRHGAEKTEQSIQYLLFLSSRVQGQHPNKKLGAAECPCNTVLGRWRHRAC